MFFIKKLISRFFFPVPVCAELLIAGFLLWRFSKHQKLGRGLVLGGIAGLLLFSYPLLPNYWLGHIEAQSVPVSIAAEASTHPCYVVVLGQGTSARSNLPPNLRFGQEFISRLVEGIRLHRALTNSTLAVSLAGASVSEPEKRHLFDQFLAIFALPTNRVTLLTTARDTGDEIRFCKQIAGTNRLYLVSSASHLPRALLMARKQGLNAIPAPASYQIDEVTSAQEPFSPTELFPSVDDLQNTTRAVYESLGLIWEKLKR